jgi:lipopolysaccharide biosynthesis glycosyltransferase
MENIPIVFAANNYYVPYMAAMIQSVMENADPNRRYYLFILHREINNDNVYLLKKQVSLFLNFSIEFINVNQYISKYNLFISRHITVEAYFRLLIPDIFSNYQKVIYLDCDMICCTDIASLFDINLENNLIAAVWDTGVAWYYSQNHSEDIKTMYSSVLLHLKKPYEYFCSGMCIFNIELFRKTISINKLLELAASREWQLHDQDVLNFLAEGKSLLLSFYWDFMFTPYAKYLPEHLQTEYNEAKKYPGIIHYKPWNEENYIPHFELFWKYATRTPFINDIIKRMNEKYLIKDAISFPDKILQNIIQRQGIGIKFLLVDCLKAWLFRDKKL